MTPEIQKLRDELCKTNSNIIRAIHNIAPYENSENDIKICELEYKKGFDACLPIVEELVEALEKTKDVVKSWHGPVAWEIYVKNAPEMRPYRDTLKKWGLK